MAIKKAKVTIVDNSIVWQFEGGKSFTVKPEDFKDEVQRQAMFHGFKQKLSDCYAGAKSVAEAQLAFEGVLEALGQGDWNKGRQSSGGIWVEALARAAKVTLEEALEKWNGFTDEEKAALKKHEGIKLAKATIELERAEKAAEGAEPLVFE